MAFQAPVSLAMPSPSLFSFPPSSQPAFLPPPPVSAVSGPLFSIPDHVYEAVLHPAVPITIAALYAVTAKALNVYNKSTGKRPWAISKTASFRAFVVAHNVFLAVYSAWTWWGMFGALRRSMVNPLGAAGLAGFVDSVCKMHGPGGLGNAVTYNEAAGLWEAAPGTGVSLASNGLPSQFDTGRMWNEGLAFYGWIFYLSKFYEVLDTFIILAKGKLSSTLQTYHHAGAMMCMWAGMRYMSAPIWVFAFVNSGIHAMMYTYYTVTAFNIRVPMLIKRTLTSLQITQFIVGASYTMMHSFVYYTVPGTTNAALEQASSGSSATAAAAASGALLDNVKAAIFGAATAGTPNATAAAAGVAFAPRTIPCINTTSSTFAIWLNVVYLLPLTYLFVSFFVASYIKRSTAELKSSRAGAKQGRSADSSSSRLIQSELAEKAGWDAAKQVEQEVYGQGNDDAVAAEEVGARGSVARRANVKTRSRAA